MFWNSKRIEALEHDLADLRDKHYKLKQDVTRIAAEVQPFMVGPPEGIRYYLHSDQRPKVTPRDAILKIMDHLKLTFKGVDAVPERVDLVKRRPA